MTCSNCGYENNPDDALSCSLCGKVFRKEVREDKKEQDKQLMSKAKKFYAEMKEEWREEAKDPTGVMSLGRGIWGIISEIWKSKGKERLEWILFLCALIIAIIIGVILAPNVGLEKALEWKSPPPGFWEESGFLGFLILFIWFFIYWILLKIFGIPTSRKEEK